METLTFCMDDRSTHLRTDKDPGKDPDLAWGRGLRSSKPSTKGAVPTAVQPGYAYPRQRCICWPSAAGKPTPSPAGPHRLAPCPAPPGPRIGRYSVRLLRGYQTRGHMGGRGTRGCTGIHTVAAPTTDFRFNFCQDVHPLSSLLPPYPST